MRGENGGGRESAGRVVRLRELNSRRGQFTFVCCAFAFTRNFGKRLPLTAPSRSNNPIALARPHRVFLDTPPFLRKARVTMGDKELAIELKNKGNAAFKAHDWPTALDFYTKAIEKYDQEPSFYTNRAQVGSLTAAREHSFTSVHRPTSRLKHTASRSRTQTRLSRSTPTMSRPTTAAPRPTRSS